MRMRAIAESLLFAALAGTVSAQSTPSTPAPSEAAAKALSSAPAKTPARFEIADIHASPSRRFPFFEGAFVENSRYIVRQATLADLIATAYGLKDSTYVHGGPSWLEWDRWDIIAKVPPGTTEAAGREMLKSLLQDRFGLAVKEGEAEVPAYWLTVAPGGLKVKETPAASADGDCKTAFPQGPPQPGSAPLLTLTCTNKPIAALAEQLTKNSAMYLQNPVVDKTGLKGAYDFTLKYTPVFMLARANGAGVTLFDAMEKDLGLKLELKTAPQPGLVVESVNQAPTPNVADLDKLMPPQPAAQFDVAVIKPSAPDERPLGRITSDAVNVHALPLRFLINFAWDLNPNDKAELVGAPKWLDEDKIDVDAKVATDNMVTSGFEQAQHPPIPIDDLREMLKAMLIERFEIKAHMEDQPVDTYTLVAVDPKMTKADPAERTRCGMGPGPDGNDPRLTHPILNMLVTCHNVTMEQAGTLFPTFAAWYLHYPALDKTGLTGGYDFTLNWSSGDNMPINTGPSSSDTQSDAAADPNGALSFYDAVRKELGLKLVKDKRPEPVLVIDHIDEQPTPN